MKYFTIEMKVLYNDQITIKKFNIENIYTFHQQPLNMMFYGSTKHKNVHWLLIEFGLTKYIYSSIGFTGPTVNIYPNKIRHNIAIKSANVWALDVYILNSAINIFQLAKKEREIYVRKDQFKYYFLCKLQAENKKNSETKMTSNHLKQLLFSGIINKEMYGLLVQTPSTEQITKHMNTDTTVSIYKKEIVNRQRYIMYPQNGEQHLVRGYQLAGYMQTKLVILDFCVCNFLMCSVFTCFTHNLCACLCLLYVMLIYVLC